MSWTMDAIQNKRHNLSDVWTSNIKGAYRIKNP